MPHVYGTSHFFIRHGFHLISQRPPFADLGGMVKENSLAITFGRMAPVMPAIALAILAIGVNLVVDGLLKHDANQDLH